MEQRTKREKKKEWQYTFSSGYALKVANAYAGDLQSNRLANDGLEVFCWCLVYQDNADISTTLAKTRCYAKA
jgi:hypothetical protein